MENFSYTAKSLSGEVKTGNLDAQNIRELAQSLKGDGLILVKAHSNSEKRKSSLNLPFFSGNVSITEKMHPGVFRELALTKNLRACLTQTLNRYPDIISVARQINRLQ